MRSSTPKVVALWVALLIGLVVTYANAQGPGRGGPGGAPGGAPGGVPATGAPAAQGSSAVANPTYVAIMMEVTVNKPAAEVWKRVGKFCDIGEWLRVNCMITAGEDGEVGAVRSLGAIGNEILVGKTDLSYVYTQPVRAGQPYNMYHGTLEALPLTGTTSKLVYRLMWDNSALADDAARETDKAQRTRTFQGALDNMKIIAEVGTLPAAAPRGGGRGAGGGAQPGGAPRGQ